MKKLSVIYYDLLWNSYHTGELEIIEEELKLYQIKKNVIFPYDKIQKSSIYKSQKIMGYDMVIGPDFNECVKTFIGIHFDNIKSLQSEILKNISGLEKLYKLNNKEMIQDERY